MRKRTYTALVGPLGDDVAIKYSPSIDKTQSVSRRLKPLIGNIDNGTVSSLVDNDAIIDLSEKRLQLSSNHELASFPTPALDDTPIATIHNLVGTCCITSSIMPIDLEYVYRSMPNSFYCRTRFAAVTIRFTDPVCTGLLFTSGKLVVTGCKSLTECILASLKIVRMLERHMPTVTFQVRSSVVQNVVAHVVIPMPAGTKLNIDKLYLDRACNCTCMHTPLSL